MNKLTIQDLNYFKTDCEEAIKLIRHYSAQYKGAHHYDQLGASSAMSIMGTINAIIGSTEYLEGNFVVPDEVHLERVVDWFLENRNYTGDRSAVSFFMGHYLKRKVNEFYRTVSNGGFSSTLTIIGNKKARLELNGVYEVRRNKGVKQIRK